MEEELRKLACHFGYDIIPAQRIEDAYFAGVIPYITPEQEKIIDFCKPFTQTGRERLFALLRSVEYLVRNNIPGAMVECGVWKGGSVMAIAMMLELLQEKRELYLFDTFTGMPQGEKVDVDLDGHDQEWYLKQNNLQKGNGKWNESSLSEVKKNIATLGLVGQQFHFIEGKVEETLLDHSPDSIALLRLDTDFYASTKHELIHLFPRLCQGGILIIDDYGHFLGARQAVDEYFREQGIRMLMHRIDYTGIIGIK